MSEATTPGAGTPVDPDATAVLPEQAFRPDAAAQEQALAEARAKADENFNQYVRALAEFDNYRKRAARDLEAAQRYAVERFASELLPVLDGFELAQQSTHGDLQSLREGQAAGCFLRIAARDFV
jgi:molecular chaperone GrpE